MECPICYEKVTNQNNLKLSCNHKICTKCFISIMDSSTGKGNIFINCPICRTVNENRFNFSWQDMKDIFTIPHRRCRGKCKNGNVCKKSVIYGNGGYCHIHQKPLSDDKKDRVVEYFNYILLCNNKWKTKIILTDIVIKLLSKGFQLDTIEDIQYYIMKFHAKRLQDAAYTTEDSQYRNTIIRYQDIYKFYDIEFPSVKWVDDCDKKKLFY